YLSESCRARNNQYEQQKTALSRPGNPLPQYWGLEPFINQQIFDEMENGGAVYRPDTSDLFLAAKNRAALLKRTSQMGRRSSRTNAETAASKKGAEASAA